MTQFWREKEMARQKDAEKSNLYLKSNKNSANRQEKSRKFAKKCQNSSIFAIVPPFLKVGAVLAS